MTQQNNNAPTMAEIIALATEKMASGWRKLRKAERQEGRIGKRDTPTTWIVDVPTRPGYVYVTLNSNSGTAPTEALCTEVIAKAGTPVYVERDIDTGEFVVKANPKQMATFSPSVPLGVGKHSHRLGFGNEDTVEGLRFEPLQPHVASGGNSMFITVEAGTYRYNGADVAFPKSNINLTSYRTGTSNFHNWAKVGIDPTTNLLVAAAGTAQSKVNPLTPAQLMPIVFASNDTLVIRICGVQLRNGQMAITDYRAFYDLRMYASGQNAAASGGNDALFLAYTGGF